jgi:hypothetical protein
MAASGKDEWRTTTLSRRTHQQGERPLLQADSTGGCNSLLESFGSVMNLLFSKRAASSKQLASRVHVMEFGFGETRR